MISRAVGYSIEGWCVDEKAESLPKFNIMRDEDAVNVGEVFDLNDSDFSFYKREILSQEGNHIHFLCPDSPVGPVAVSITKNTECQRYIALIRSGKGNKRSMVPIANVPESWWRRLLNFGPSQTDILNTLDHEIPSSNMKKVVDPRLPQALLSMEEQQVIKGIKFGVLYAQEGQVKEDDMFSNVETSKEFEDFLTFLGDRVQLRDWTNFRAGLDVKSGTTGEHSIYTRYRETEIMFHVSTLLPFNPKDKQQLERKRHIGNDIVVIVFQDGSTVYKPTTISSRQVHVVFVVQEVEIPEQPGQKFYRLSVVSRDGVPRFGPEIPNYILFKKGPEFREFLFAKLLNAELASYSAPIIGGKLLRTKTSMLKDIVTNFLK